MLAVIFLLTKRYWIAYVLDANNNGKFSFKPHNLHIPVYLSIFSCYKCCTEMLKHVTEQHKSTAEISICINIMFVLRKCVPTSGLVLTYVDTRLCCINLFASGHDVQAQYCHISSSTYRESSFR